MLTSCSISSSGKDGGSPLFYILRIGSQCLVHTLFFGVSVFSRIYRIFSRGVGWKEA